VERRACAGVETPNFHPTDLELSVGTPAPRWGTHLRKGYSLYRDLGGLPDGFSFARLARGRSGGYKVRVGRWLEGMRVEAGSRGPGLKNNQIDAAIFSASFRGGVIRDGSVFAESGGGDSGWIEAAIVDEEAEHGHGSSGGQFPV